MPRFVWFIYFGLFAIPMLVSLGLLWSSASTALRWERTLGTVVDVAQENHVVEALSNERSLHATEERSGIGLWHPVIEYPMPDGTLNRFFPRSGTVELPALKVGDQVPVYFEPGDPRNACIGSYSYLWSFTVGTTGLTVALMLLFGVPMVFLSKNVPTIERLAEQQEALVAVENESEVVLDRFLEAAGTLNYDEASQIMSEAAQENMPVDAFLGYNMALLDELGPYQRRETGNKKTSLRSDGSAKLDIEYTLHHEKGPVKANFVFERSDGEWLITWYGIEW